VTLHAPPRPAWAKPRQPTEPTNWRQRARSPHASLALALFATYTLTAVLRYHRYGSASFDLAIFTEAVKAYAHGHAPTVPIKGEGYNILGDHLSPVIATLAPIWRLWPSPLMLLTAQAALFAWSAGIVSDTAARHLGRARGLCTGIAYGLSFGILRAVDAEFHEIAFAVPLIAMTGRHLLARRWHHAAWWAAPLCLVKEDLGLTVAAVGILIAIQGRRRIAGPLLAAAGIAVTAAAIWWVIPHFNPAGHFDYWAKADHHSWTHAAWQAVSRLQTWKTIAWTLGVTGMLALRAPLVVLAAPTIAWRMLSTNSYFWSPDWHYSAVLMPIVFLAAVDTAHRLQQSRRLALRQFTDRTVTALPAVAIACMAAMTYGPGDLARKDAWTGGPVAAARAAALARIPDGVTVETTKGLAAPLAARTDAYWVGGLKSRPPQFVVYDRHDWEAPKAEEAVGRAQEAHPRSTYQLVFSREGVTVVRLVQAG